MPGIKHKDAEATAAREQERREREGLDEAQASRGPDRRPPAPVSREAEIGELRARIAQAQQHVEAIHQDRQRAHRRATERVNKWANERRRLRGATDRTVDTATAAFGRLVEQCRDDEQLDREAAEWLRSLQQRDATPPPPPDGLLTRFLLGRPESGFAEWIEGAIVRAHEGGDPSGHAGPDPRSRSELADEIERVEGSLEAAQRDEQAAKAAAAEAAAALNAHLRGGSGEPLFRFLDTTNGEESR